MRSSQRSVCDTVSEAVSQAQGRASRFAGNGWPGRGCLVLGQYDRHRPDGDGCKGVGISDETMVMPGSAAGAGTGTLRLRARAGRRQLQMSLAEGTKEERPLGNTQGGALSTQH